MNALTENQKHIIRHLDLAKGILNDSNTFLWARSHPDNPVHKGGQIPPLGGGNWLIISGCFSVFLLCAAVNWYLESDKDHSDAAAFKKLVKDLPAHLPSGLPKKTNAIDAVLLSFRNSLAHRAIVGKECSGITLLTPNGYSWAINTLHSQWRSTDRVLILDPEQNQAVSTAFYKENKRWQCFSDLLNQEMYAIVDYVRQKIFSADPESVNRVIAWIEKYD